MSRIHQRVYGQGRPLVMLHGWAMHGGIWQAFAEALAEDCQVICLDLPGHGLSDGLDDYSLDAITDALLAAIDVPRFALLGWSLGATVALNMAARFPERVDALCLLAGNARFTASHAWPGVGPDVLAAFAGQLQHDSRQTLLRFLALQVQGLVDGKAILKSLKEAVMAAPEPQPAALLSGLRLLQDSDLRPQLRAIHCSVHAIQGDRDALIPPETAAAMQELKPDLKITCLEGAGHVPFLSHRQALVTGLREWL